MTNITWVAAPSFTRPNDTTAYADGDLVANSTTAGSVTPLKFVIPWKRSCIIRGASVRKSDGADVTGADFVVHLFRNSPTPANGDNGALSTDYAEKIGTIDVGQMVSYTDDAYSVAFGGNFYVEANNNDRMIYGLLEADGVYTPAANEVFDVKIFVEQE
jgi:hypothetical protein